jgi:hypothetical protein
VSLFFSYAAVAQLVWLGEGINRRCSRGTLRHLIFLKAPRLTYRTRSHPDLPPICPLAPTYALRRPRNRNGPRRPRALPAHPRSQRPLPLFHRLRPTTARRPIRMQEIAGRVRKAPRGARYRRARRQCGVLWRRGRLFQSQGGLWAVLQECAPLPRVCGQ